MPNKLIVFLFALFLSCGPQPYNENGINNKIILSDITGTYNGSMYSQDGETVISFLYLKINNDYTYTSEFEDDYGHITSIGALKISGNNIIFSGNGNIKRFSNNLALDYCNYTEVFNLIKPENQLNGSYCYIFSNSNINNYTYKFSENGKIFFTSDTIQ